MLQTSAIHGPTLAALKKVMGIPSLKNFYLVGGTALALIKGHRLSVDIDLFSANISFDVDRVSQELMGAGALRVKSLHSYAMFLEFDNVKTDIVTYSYPWINPTVELEGIRIASIEDILAMKLSAVSQRGAKKDFYDIYFFLEDYSLIQMIDFFKKKFPQSEPYMVLKSLLYFDDADNTEDPVVLKGNVAWPQVKETIAKAVKDFL